jgi:hypothetical protein
MCLICALLGQYAAELRLVVLVVGDILCGGSDLLGGSLSRLLGSDFWILGISEIRSFSSFFWIFSLCFL